MTPTVLILGGYGNAGRPIAELLLNGSEARVIIAGRNGERAAAFAADLNGRVPGERAAACRADAADTRSLTAALNGVDLLVLAASAIAHTDTVADAVLDAGVDCLDTLLSSPAKLAALTSRRDRFERSGRRWIADGGFHPGVPAALVRYAAGRIDALERAVVASRMRIDWAGLRFSPETAPEMAAELADFRPRAFREGTWLTDWNHFRRVDFGPPLHETGLRCVAMDLAEMAPLPGMIPSLRETGFYVAGFDPLTDNLVMPLGWMALKLFPGALRSPAGRMLAWSLRRGSRAPFGVILVLEASGRHEGRPVDLRVELAHADGYLMTAAPVVACLRQFFALDFPAGIHLQGLVVEPRRFLEDLESMGIAVRITGALS